MSFTIKAHSEEFFCEISGIDLQRPFPPDIADQVRRAMDKFGASVFRDQQLTDERQIAFSQQFGTLEFSPHFGRGAGETVRMKFPELFDVSNLDDNNQILPDSDRRREYRAANLMWHTDRRREYRAANLMWHTDSSFQPGAPVIRCYRRGWCRRKVLILSLPTCGQRMTCYHWR